MCAALAWLDEPLVEALSLEAARLNVSLSFEFWTGLLRTFAVRVGSGISLSGVTARNSGVRSWFTRGSGSRGSGARSSGTGNSSARSSGAGESRHSSGTGSSHVVSVDATLLTVGKFLAIGRRASALRARGDTVVGIFNLTVIGARRLVTLGDAAAVAGIA